MPALTVIALCKKYHYDKFFTLENLSFCVDTGETVTLMLDLQSGKTTLAKIICGAEKPTSGSVLLGVPRAALYLSAAPLFFPRKTLLKNLMYPAQIRKIKTPQARALAQEAAEKHGLCAHLNAKAKTLSRQTLFAASLARGEMRPVSLVIADGLNKEELSAAAAFCRQKCAALLILTADASQAAGRVIIHSGGKTLFEGDKAGAEEALKSVLWLFSEQSLEQTSAQKQ